MPEQKENPHFPVDLERLSILLQELPLNQTELAEQLHVSTSEISKWKSGERQISKRALIKLCELAACNPSWLQGLSDHRQPEILWEQLDISQMSGEFDPAARGLLLSFMRAFLYAKCSKLVITLGKTLTDHLAKQLENPD